ncbi:hypothetical protein [Streptomyces sp. NPDC018045]
MRTHSPDSTGMAERLVRTVKNVRAASVGGAAGDGRAARRR